MVASGVKVSPMRNFFLALGFDGYADRAVEVYEREFMKRYLPPLFEGVDEMIRALFAAHLKLGIVTSNTKDNVLASLGNLIEYFDPSCLFFYDSLPIRLDKRECLIKGVSMLKIAKNECVYVGDQPSDAHAADEAGVPFLGVSYGWGITESNRFRVVDTVRGLRNLVLAEAINVQVQ
jgi:phosphoglycolate phosphatase-like HAD superfamily hydrolase